MDGPRPCPSRPVMAGRPGPERPLNMLKKPPGKAPEAEKC